MHVNNLSMLVGKDIDTSAMWQGKDIDYTKKSKDPTKDYSLDLLVFRSQKIYVRIFSLECHLENIQLTEGTHKAYYIMNNDSYVVSDDIAYGEYGTTTVPVCFVQADIIWDNHKERKTPLKGKVNGIIRPALDDNYECKIIPPEFHFYLTMPKQVKNIIIEEVTLPEQIIFGHSTQDVDEDSSKKMHINITNVDSSIVDRHNRNLLDRFKHLYSEKQSDIVPPWFNVKTYHGNIRRENFSKGVFVTTLEQ